MSETDQRPHAAAPGSGPSPAAPVVRESAQMPTPLGSQHAQLTRWALWLRNFWPGPVRIDLQELLRMALGVALGLLVTGMLSRWWTDVPTSTWMVSSLGASAVLLFGMPASPLAQPWPVLGGTVVSALVGALCQRLVPDLAVAAALSVGLSILLMVPLRCMHPPGAGFAAFVVLEHADGVALVAFPILFNVAVLVLCAVVYNALTGKRYPHPQHSYKGAGSARFVSPTWMPRCPITTRCWTSAGPIWKGCCTWRAKRLFSAPWAICAVQTSCPGPFLRWSHRWR